jgi:hypothetical protein
MQAWKRGGGCQLFLGASWREPVNASGEWLAALLTRDWSRNATAAHTAQLIKRGPVDADTSKN